MARADGCEALVADRIVGGLAWYWIYQYIGNLAPAERARDRLWAAVHMADGDAGPLVDDHAAAADAEPAGTRWSFARDVGRVRLVVLDSRAARVLEPGQRALLNGNSPLRAVFRHVRRHNAS